MNNNTNNNLSIGSMIAEVLAISSVFIALGILVSNGCNLKIRTKQSVENEQKEQEKLPSGGQTPLGSGQRIDIMRYEDFKTWIDGIRERVKIYSISQLPDSWEDDGKKKLIIVWEPHNGKENENIGNKTAHQ